MKLDFDLGYYVERIRKGKPYFHTFISRPSLAAGVLVLGPGEEDTQEPHDSDELYYVISGDGYLRIRNRDYPVSGDRLFFVAKGVRHYFHGNKKELKAVYFFGGPDSADYRLSADYSDPLSCK